MVGEQRPPYCFDLIIDNLPFEMQYAPPSVGHTTSAAPLRQFRPSRNEMISELTPLLLPVVSWPPRQILAGDDHPSLSHLHPSAESKDMFGKQKRTASGTSGSNPDRSRCEWIQHPRGVSSLITWSLLAKKQRIADGGKVLLDIAKESAHWLPPLKSALGGLNALIKHIEVLVEWITVVRD